MEASSAPAANGADASNSGRRRGRRPPPEELVERRRAEIIEAAYEVFSTRGYSASGIADIAERLGIGHGTFYRYFKNKRDILDQVVDYGVERIVSALELETAEPARTLDQFRDQLRHIGERLFALLDEEMTQRELGLLDTFGALGAAFVQSGVNHGFLRAELDTASLGRAITGLTLPGLFAAVRGEVGPHQRTRYIDAMVGLVCDGIGARPDA